MPTTPKLGKKIDAGKLRELMVTAFHLSDLQEISSDLELNLELVEGSTKKDYARKLIQSVEASGHLGDLVDLCRRKRPGYSWKSVYRPIEEREAPVMRAPEQPEVVNGKRPSFWWGLTAVPLLLLAFLWWCAGTGCFCTYQADNDYDTIVQIIRAESQAANAGNLAIIEDIFAADAYIVQQDPNGDVTEWFDPLSHYGPLFDSTRFIDAMHTDISGTITGRTARFVSGSQGSYVQNGERGEYSNAADNPDEQEIWELKKTFWGCWQITSLLFH